MPWVRFLAMSGAIAELQAEDDLRAVFTTAHGANPGDKGRGLREFVKGLRKQAKIHAPEDEISTARAGIIPQIVAEREPGSIERERERQRAAVERMEAERKAREAGQRG